MQFCHDVGIAAKVGEQFNFGMGYLSSRNFDNAAMNWIAEGVNTVGQGALFVGAVLLHKNGLAASRPRREEIA